MGGGGSDTTSYIAAQAPEVFTPIAPERATPEPLPDNIDKAVVTPGAKRSAKEKKVKQDVMSQLVIPIQGNTQAGGTETVRKPRGVV